MLLVINSLYKIKTLQNIIKQYRHYRQVFQNEKKIFLMKPNSASPET